MKLLMCLRFFVLVLCDYQTKQLCHKNFPAWRTWNSNRYFKGKTSKVRKLIAKSMVDYVSRSLRICIWRSNEQISQSSIWSHSFSLCFWWVVFCHLPLSYINSEWMVLVFNTYRNLKKSFLINDLLLGLQ